MIFVMRFHALHAMLVVAVFTSLFSFSGKGQCSPNNLSPNTKYRRSPGPGPDGNFEKNGEDLTETWAMELLKKQLGQSGVIMGDPGQDLDDWTKAGTCKVSAEVGKQEADHAETPVTIDTFQDFKRCV